MTNSDTNSASDKLVPPEKSKKNSELKSRIIFGLLMAIGAFTLTWLGGIGFQILISICAVIMFDEYRKICSSVLPKRVAFVAFLFLVLIIVGWIAKAHETSIIILVSASIALLAWEMIIRRSGWGAVGLIYIALPFLALVHLRGVSEEGFYTLILLFALVWGADTMAYVAGKLIGGPKLAPKISPGKTWAGFFGGLFGGVLIGVIVMLIGGYSVKAAFFPLAGLLVILSQIGDLAESVLKRKFGVKDSGTIIPGHGGILDRVDGLVFSAVLAWLIAMFGAGIVFGAWNWEPAAGLLSLMVEPDM